MDRGRGWIGIVAIAGLLVAVVALLISVEAYNRTGRQLQELARETFGRIEQQFQAQLEDFQLAPAQGLAISRTESRLESVRSDIEGETVGEDTMQTIRDAREDLDQTFADTEQVVQQRVQAINSQLALLEDQVMQAPQAALVTIEETMRMLEQLRETRDQNNDEQ
jgi:hypothetical protein